MLRHGYPIEITKTKNAQTAKNNPLLIAPNKNNEA